MDYWMCLVYFLLGALVFFGARSFGRGQWNGEYTSLKETKALQGAAALMVAFHHMAQKTCASWVDRGHIVHGLDVFLQAGFLMVAVFFFCSGLGLYRSLKTKPDYLKGFFRRRILPMVIAYYLSEYVYLAVRCLYVGLRTGRWMNAGTVLLSLTGVRLVNANAWYLAVIPFFYLAFWLAFRFCKREGTAILWVTAAALGYTALGLTNHRDDIVWLWGDWWYNSVILFPLGLFFGKYEQNVTGAWKKGYWLWLALCLGAEALLWSRYGSFRGDLARTAAQWLIAAAFVMFWFLLRMKIRIGNRALAFLGGIGLEFYLMHGLFVDLFGYSFMDTPYSLYIRSLPLYIAAVLASSVAASLLFRLLWKGTVKLLLRPKPKT